MSCLISLELRPLKLSAVRTDEGRLFQKMGAQHENRRAAMFVNEDCVESRSDVDDLRTRDCLYDESRPVRCEVVIVWRLCNIGQQSWVCTKALHNIRYVMFDVVNSAKHTKMECTTHQRRMFVADSQLPLYILVIDLAKKFSLFIAGAAPTQHWVRKTANRIFLQRCRLSHTSRGNRQEFETSANRHTDQGRHLRGAVAPPHKPQAKNSVQCKTTHTRRHILARRLRCHYDVHTVCMHKYVTTQFPQFDASFLMRCRL